jgi:hypothetical protein
MSFVHERDAHPPPRDLDFLEFALRSFFPGTTSATKTREAFRTILGTSTPFDRLLTIIETSDHPIPNFPAYVPVNPRISKYHWTNDDDRRLCELIELSGPKG